MCDNNNTILYVDDEEINTLLFEINFKKKYEVLTASSGKEGLNLLDQNTEINIIISDMKMPNMNGLEFIKKAQVSHSNKDYYMLSGFAISSEIREALNSGLIQGYFMKPFNRNEIQQAIEKSISKYKK